MALKIKTREEAIAVLRDMVRRKKEMEAKAQIDFAKAREEAADCYACAFNLTRLNFHSPYKVWIDNGSYKFLTDYGVQYRIEFVENNNIWEDEKAYEFGILNENKKNSPNDSKVKATIQCIIEEFFLTNPDILLYQCETGDSRQAMRARLFTRWFNEFDKRDRFCVKVSILRDEEVDNYIAIIVQKSNPKLNDILRDFDEFIGFFDTKPE